MINGHLLRSVLIAAIGGVATPIAFSAPNANQIVAEATGGGLKTAKGTFYDSSCGENLPYEAKLVDLNDDGQPEVFIAVDGQCLGGMSGSYFDLWMKNPSGQWERQLATQGMFVVRKTKTKGYRDIEVAGPGINTPIWRWDGKKYAATPTDLATRNDSRGEPTATSKQVAPIVVAPPKGNLLEMATYPGASTKQMYARFKDEGGLNTTNKWNGLQMQRLELDFDQRGVVRTVSMKVALNGYNWIGQPKVTTPKEIREVLTKVCKIPAARWKTYDGGFEGVGETGLQCMYHAIDELVILTSTPG